MLQGENFRIAVLGENRFESLQLIIYGWLRRMKILVYAPSLPPRVRSLLNRLFFIRRYVKESVIEHNAGADNYNGIGHEIHQKVIDLTLKYFDGHITGNNKIVTYYNRIFNTNKFEAYIKKQISSQIYTCLNELNFIRLFNMCEKEILIIKSPINEFVVAYMQDSYKLRYRIKWISPLWGMLALLSYYMWLFSEFFIRGITFNAPKKGYKLAKEAVLGFSSSTLRDDILIENNKFKKDDILLLRFVKEDIDRQAAFKRAKELGFDTASVPDLKINVNKNIFWFLYFYILVPAKVYFQLFLSRQSNIFYYMLMFHWQSLPLEILMNHYKIRCYITTREWGGVEETIVFNKYRTEDIAFHWSDLTCLRAYIHAFVAHNIYFAWGNKFYSYYADNSYVNKWTNIGCIYKKKYNLALRNKEWLIKEIGSLNRENKTVAFFDTSFGHYFTRYTERFFMQYLYVVKEFCERNKGINILLKPKNTQDITLSLLRGNIDSYKKTLQVLANYANFTYLDLVRWSMEEIVAISDVSIGMGMNTTTTVALICGRQGLYFDPTGNNDHPFSEAHKNKIVFDDKEGLFKQIDNILKGRFNCHEIIREQEIRGFDAFDDDKAVDRLKDNLYQLTLSQN